MRRLSWCIIAVAVACGTGAGEPKLTTAPPPEVGLWGGGECSLRCERIKRQLVGDFGVTEPIDCWSYDFFSAGSPCACEALFSRRWGVLGTTRAACP